MSMSIGWNFSAYVTRDQKIEHRTKDENKNTIILQKLFLFLGITKMGTIFTLVLLTYIVSQLFSSIIYYHL